MIKRLLTPRPAVLLALVTGVVVVAIAFTVVRTRPEPSAEAEALASIETIAAEITQKDSDGDGLRDWEESLWKTDPTSKDTDGDGMSDNEEVIASRDPLVAGPGKKEEVTSVSSASVVGEYVEPSEEVTFTDALGINLFQEYLRVKQGGGDPEAGSEDIAVKLLSSLEVTVQPVYYGKTDLLRARSDATSTVNTYKNGVELAVGRLAAIPEYELATLSRALETNDDKALEQFKSYKNVYQAIIDDLLLVSVPTSAEDAHVALLNGFSGVVSMLGALEKVNRDPLLAMAALNQYRVTEENLRTAFKQLGSFALIKNVSFNFSL